MKYTEIISLAAVFAALNLPADQKPDVSRWPARYHAHKQIEYDVQMAIDAINGDWVADWKDPNQKKHWLWAISVEDSSKVSGRGLSLDVVNYDRTYTCVGPRLVFETREKALHFWKYFQELYENYYFS